ncbi:MAG: MMPL family transporter [Acidimicrobiales bacterium]
MGLPRLTAAFGIGCGTAVLSRLANVVTMPTVTIQLVLMLGVGIGYALFIVTRYRQALHGGLGPQQAVVQAIDTAGGAVLFAGGTVVLSVLGLFFIGTDLTSALAIAAATGVLLTMLASVTSLPAVPASWAAASTGSGSRTPRGPAISAPDCRTLPWRPTWRRPSCAASCRAARRSRRSWRPRAVSTIGPWPTTRSSPIAFASSWQMNLTSPSGRCSVGSPS